MNPQLESNVLEQYDLRTLQDLYLRESQAFSMALETGAPWQELKQLRARVSTVSDCINRKYHEQYRPGERRRHGHPHGN